MKTSRRTYPLAIIFCTVLIDLLGFGILIPVIPLLLANPLSEYFMLPRTLNLSQGYILLGFLTGVYPLMQFLSAPILGQLSDRYGRKKILALSLAGTCASYVVFAIGVVMKNIPLLFLSRAVDGITGGNISVAQAAIADITTPQNRAKNFGLIGAAFGLGFILGPYVGGKLSDPSVFPSFTAATPFWFAAVLSFLNTVSVLFFFPETRSVISHAAIRWGQSIQNIIRAFGIKVLRPIFTTVFLLQGGFSFFTTFFSVFLMRKFSFGQGDIGDFFSYIGLWIAFTQAVLTRRAANKFAEYQILRVTLFGTGIAIILFFFPVVWWQLLLVAPIFAMFNGLTQANLTALVSQSVDASIQGEILGINASIQALAQSLPPILSGFIAASLTPEAPLAVSALVTLCAAGVFLFWYKPPLAKAT